MLDYLLDVFRSKQYFDAITNARDVAGGLTESAHGWEERRGSVFHVAAQVPTSQQLEPARANLARLRQGCDVLMTNPVP